VGVNPRTRDAKRQLSRVAATSARRHDNESQRISASPSPLRGFDRTRNSSVGWRPRLSAAAAARRNSCACYTNSNLILSHHCPLRTSQQSCVETNGRSQWHPVNALCAHRWRSPKAVTRLDDRAGLEETGLRASRDSCRGDKRSHRTVHNAAQNSTGCDRDRSAAFDAISGRAMTKHRPAHTSILGIKWLSVQCITNIFLHIFSHGRGSEISENASREETSTSGKVGYRRAKPRGSGSPRGGVTPDATRSAKMASFGVSVAAVVVNGVVAAGSSCRPPSAGRFWRWSRRRNDGGRDLTLPAVRQSAKPRLNPPAASYPR